MTKIGYARTSTVEQNLDSQIIALKAANCEIMGIMTSRGQIRH